MPETIEIPGRTSAVDAVWADVVRVCRRIPPLWDLSNYVAVNPFLGFTECPVDHAALVIGDGLGAQVLPDVAFYRGRFEADDFGPQDLARAARRAGRDPAALEAVLKGFDGPPTRPHRPALTLAERHDREYGGAWEEAVVRQITRWCAVHASGGGTYWGLPADGRGLFASWLEAARVDRTLEILGLTGWRRWARDIPETPGEAIAALLTRQGLTAAGRADYLYHLLAGVYGWASFFRRDPWSRGDETPVAVADLLAVRLCADSAVDALAPTPARPASAPARRAPAVEDESTRLVFQEALEDGFARRLFGGLNPPDGPAPSGRPAVQAVFCIDVRSEPLRRHLEAQSDAVETRGFAGFFGVSLDWQPDPGCGGPRCPVLLRPSVTVRGSAATPRGPSLGALKHVQGAPAAAFNFVEVLGLAYGIGLAADALALRASAKPAEGSVPFDLDPDGKGGGIPPAARVPLAAGILKNMGFGETFARLVLLCGHEGRSANNPHAAGLDCGACGGHGGAINARVAAALLNDPAVREGLRGLDWDLPADTRFVAGVHDTSADEVTLLDTQGVPATHAAELDQLRGWLARAGASTRAERAPALGLAGASTGVLRRLFRRRARDWSEVRPEWGLARNAAFVAARRRRTRGVDLQGRAFLHEYDHTLDPDGSVLTLILCAPVVVASWINLQYFASTVDNRTFGCGNKALHNRVGSLGVVLGNGGDLRTGLPLQSVHTADGRFYHEPLRLQVVVEAPRPRLDAVLDAQPGVRALVENGWVRLFALDPEGNGSHRRLPGGEWEPTADPAPPPRPRGVGRLPAPA